MLCHYGFPRGPTAVGASERPQETGRSTNERHSLWLTCTTSAASAAFYKQQQRLRNCAAEIADCVIGKTLEAVVLVAPNCGIKARAAFKLQTLPLQPCSQRGLLPSNPRTASSLSLNPSQMANNIKVSPASGNSEETSGKWQAASGKCKCFLLWTIIVNLLVLIKNALVKEALGRCRFCYPRAIFQHFASKEFSFYALWALENAIGYIATDNVIGVLKYIYSCVGAWTA